MPVTKQTEWEFQSTNKAKNHEVCAIKKRSSTVMNLFHYRRRCIPVYNITKSLLLSLSLSLPCTVSIVQTASWMHLCVWIQIVCQAERQTNDLLNSSTCSHRKNPTAHNRNKRCFYSSSISIVLSISRSFTVSLVVVFGRIYRINFIRERERVNFIMVFGIKNLLVGKFGTLYTETYNVPPFAR